MSRMASGKALCSVALHPMSGDYVGVIKRAIKKADEAEAFKTLERNTDHVSTQLRGPPEDVFHACRVLLESAAGEGVHCALDIIVQDELGSSRTIAKEDPSTLGSRAGAEGEMGVHLQGRMRVHGGATDLASLFRAAGLSCQEESLCWRIQGDLAKAWAAVQQAFLAGPEGNASMACMFAVNAPSGSS